MKRTLFKKLIRCLFIAPALVSITFLSSCNPDLGKYDSVDGYEDFLDDIYDISAMYEIQDPADQNKTEFTIVSFDLKDSITNEYIMQYLKCEDITKEVAFEKYVYIVIPFRENLKIESLALYVKANTSEEVRLDFSAFYFKDFDSCPEMDKLKKMNDPDSGTYSDPLMDNRIASASLRIIS